MAFSKIRRDLQHLCIRNRPAAGAGRKPAGWITHVLAALLACFVLVGSSYLALDSWDLIFMDGRLLPAAGLRYACCLVIFDICLILLYRAIWNAQNPLPAGQRVLSGINPAGGEKKRPAVEALRSAVCGFRLPAWVQAHYRLSCFLLIAVFWLPYLLVNLPGSVPADGYWQINEGMGFNALTNHHPWVLSLLFAAVLRAGRPVSDNFGVFLISAGMFLTEAWCYAVVCDKISRWRGDAGSIRACAAPLFFAVLPLFGAYAQAVIKDSLFTALTALFFALYVDICVGFQRGEPVKNPVRTFSVLFLVELAVCLTRNNGIYLTLPADILLLFFLCRGQRRYAVCLALLLYAAYACIEGPAAEAAGVTPGSAKEALSVPFQQTARYLKEYPDDVTAEEKWAMASVLPFPLLAEAYNPELSDPVKDLFLPQGEVFLPRYFRHAWVPMLFRHPDSYVQSFLNNTYGYYYPFANRDILAAYQFYIKSEYSNGNLDIHYLFPQEVRTPVSAYAEKWRSLPVLKLLMNPASCTWVLLALAGFLVYARRYRALLVLAAPFLNVAVCLASPVNGLLRYAAPLVACMPVVIYWCVDGSRDRRTVSRAERKRKRG